MPIKTSHKCHKNVKEVCGSSFFIDNDNKLYNIDSPTNLIANNVKFAENNAYTTVDNKIYIEIIVHSGPKLL